MNQRQWDLVYGLVYRLIIGAALMYILIGKW